MRRGCICLLAVLANRRCENSKQEYSFLHRNKMKQSGEEGGRHVGFINQVVGGVSIGPAWGYNEETLKGRTIRAADVEGIHRMLYKLLYDRRQCRSCNHDILLVSRYQISQQRFPCPWIHTEFSHTKQENRLQMTAHSLISPQLRLKKNVCEHLSYFFIATQVSLCILVHSDESAQWELRPSLAWTILRCSFPARFLTSLWAVQRGTSLSSHAAFQPTTEGCLKFAPALLPALFLMRLNCHIFF